MLVKLFSELKLVTDNSFVQQLTEKPLKGKEIDASTSVEWPEIYFLDDLLFFPIHCV